MTAISSPIPSTKDNLRPFDVRRDLKAVADLVERCFITTLDADGRRYIKQMHAAAHNPSYLQWASFAAERIPMPLSGYIWEEDGMIVGNLSLIPFKTEGLRCYLIANVAVDQHFRRRGIARALTLQAIAHAQRKGAHAVWLHVRAENNPAVNLYLSMGFNEQLRRSTWHSGEELFGSSPAQSTTTPAEVIITPPKKHHWPQQQTWLEEIYPPEIIWHMPFNINAFNPTLRGSFYRMMTATSMKQWAALSHDKLIGVLSWQPFPNHSDNLWLATSPENEETAISSLLPHVRHHLPRQSQLTLDYPAERGVQALKEGGLLLHQTLIWMVLKLNRE
jgi:GNAT superfamily N-acetyltransferase